MLIAATVSVQITRYTRLSMANPPKAPQLRRGKSNPKATSTSGTLVPLPGGAVVPPMPDHFGPEAQAAWEFAWTAGAGVYVPRRDMRAIVRYCELAQRRADLAAEVDEVGHVTVGSQGQPVLNPALRALMDVEAALDRLEAKLGLNPTDAARLGLTTAAVRTKLDEIRERQARARAGIE